MLGNDRGPAEAGQAGDIVEICAVIADMYRHLTLLDGSVVVGNKVVLEIETEAALAE